MFAYTDKTVYAYGTACFMYTHAYTGHVVQSHQYNNKKKVPDNINVPFLQIRKINHKTDDYNNTKLFKFAWPNHKSNDSKIDIGA